jgi:hypothetical protein
MRASVSVNDDAMQRSPLSAHKFSLALFLLLDLVLIALFFIDGRDDERAFLQREILHYSVLESVADLVALSLIRGVLIGILHLRFGLLKVTPFVAVAVLSALVSLSKIAVVYYFNSPNSFSSIKSTLMFYSAGIPVADLVILLLARDLLVPAADGNLESNSRSGSAQSSFKKITNIFRANEYELTTVWFRD